MSKGKFQSLRDQLIKILLQWGENFLTPGGKEFLIKAVAQAIPVYVMGVFKLPFGLLDELTKLIRDFWWGAEKGKCKTHWVSWDSMLRPKDQGVLGSVICVYLTKPFLRDKDGVSCRTQTRYVPKS